MRVISSAVLDGTVTRSFGEFIKEEARNKKKVNCAICINGDVLVGFGITDTCGE